MTDDRIIDIFQEHGQYVTGKDYAMIRAIAEAVSPQRQWVGLTLDERLELAQDVDWAAGAYCEYAEKIEAKLKEKNA